MIVANVRKRNPLRLDPTRTGMLRRAFEAEIYKRYRKIKGKILQLVDKEDAFGLRDKLRVVNTRFAFLSDPEKIAEFEKWLQTQIEEDILGGVTEAGENVWLQRYIAQGYEKGAGRAFDDVRKPALASKNGSVSDFFQGTRDEFLRQSFANPEALDKVKILVSRTFSDLKGSTEAMAAQVRRELADGLVRGENPREIAKALNNRVDKIGRTRANVIARTEIIRAHGEGQLDAFERLDVAEVGVMAEWSTAGDDRVCPLCQPLEGSVMTIKEARGILPRHPQCRCTWIPANVGEDKRGQKRGSAQLGKARNESIRREVPKVPLQEAKEQTRWRGADTKFRPKRPKSVLDADLREQKREGIKIPERTPKPAREPISKPVMEGVRGSSILKFEGEISDDFRNEMVSHLESLPVPHRNLLESKGYEVKASDLISSTFPELKGVTPRGWMTGTWDNADGLFNQEKKIISVTEKRIHEGNAIKSVRRRGVLTHETGHAIDQALDQISELPSFKDVWKEEARNLLEDTGSVLGKDGFSLKGEASELAYFLQPQKNGFGVFVVSDAGSSEAFAEGYAILQGSGAGTTSQVEKFKKYFPKTLQKIEEILEGISP